MQTYIKLGLAIGLLVAALNPSRAEEVCGRVNERKLHIDESTRFRLLGEYGGRAFIDMRTCLVWRLDIFGDRGSFDDAWSTCAHTGQGGPYGEMGWRLPTVAELTSPG